MQQILLMLQEQVSESSFCGNKVIFFQEYFEGHDLHRWSPLILFFCYTIINLILSLMLFIQLCDNSAIICLENIVNSHWTPCTVSLHLYDIINKSLSSCSLKGHNATVRQYAQTAHITYKADTLDSRELKTTQKDHTNVCE